MLLFVNLQLLIRLHIKFNETKIVWLCDMRLSSPPMKMGYFDVPILKYKHYTKCARCGSAAFCQIILYTCCSSALQYGSWDWGRRPNTRFLFTFHDWVGPNPNVKELVYSSVDNT